MAQELQQLAGPVQILGCCSCRRSWACHALVRLVQLAESSARHSRQACEQHTCSCSRLLANMVRYGLGRTCKAATRSWGANLSKLPFAAWTEGSGVFSCGVGGSMAKISAAIMSKHSLAHQIGLREALQAAPLSGNLRGC